MGKDNDKLAATKAKADKLTKALLEHSLGETDSSVGKLENTQALANALESKKDQFKKPKEKKSSCWDCFAGLFSRNKKPTKKEPDATAYVAPSILKINS